MVFLFVGLFFRFALRQNCWPLAGESQGILTALLGKQVDLGDSGPGFSAWPVLSNRRHSAGSSWKPALSSDILMTTEFAGRGGSHARQAGWALPILRLPENVDPASAPHYQGQGESIQHLVAKVENLKKEKKSGKKIF